MSNEEKLIEIYINEAGNVQCRLAVKKLTLIQAGDISNFCQMIGNMMLTEILRQGSPFQPMPEKESWEDNDPPKDW